MSWWDVITLTVAALAGLECVTGRIGAMYWRLHRHRLLVGYYVASGVCFLAASLIWQGADSQLLDVAAWGIAAHLVLTWRDWRDGAPPSALQRHDGLPGLSVGAALVHHRDDRRHD